MVLLRRRRLNNVAATRAAGKRETAPAVWPWRVEAAVSAALLLSCVYNYVESPRVMCAFESCRSKSSAFKTAMFPRVVAVACLLSRAAAAYKSACAVAAYDRTVRDYELRHPTDPRRERSRRVLVAAAAAVCVAVMLSTNVYRLYLLHRNYRDANILVFFTLMYVQNASTCMTEIQFVGRCLGLYQKLQSINQEMSAFKWRTIVMNRYPLVLRPDDGGNLLRRRTRRRDRAGNSGNVDDDDRFVRPRARASCSKSVELLKMRHQFVGGTAISDLNDLYSFQLGVSLSVLFAMTLFDIYDVVAYEGKFEKSKTYMLLYGWMTQYAFRFCMIVLTTHATTKQAQKPKSLITDINNRYLDNNTKEELRSFMNQFASRTMEFTTFDFFTLNTHLITSAIVAGTTYLVILLQIN